MSHPSARLKNSPFSPNSFPFFYGWVIVAVATVGVIASIPGQTMGVGVFTVFLMEALNLTSEELSLAYMGGTITSSFLLPYAGSLIDHWGVRLMSVVSSVGLALSLVALSFCGVVAGFFSAQFLVAFLVAVFCFLGVRFFGQGALTVTSRVAIGKWFNHRRGLATAISGIGVATGFSISPAFLNILIEQFGWRGACWMLAGLVGIGMAILGWLFFRESPEQHGLHMDGVSDPAWHERMSQRLPEIHKEFTRREALGTYTFWVYSFAASTMSLTVTAVVFHLALIGAEQGISREAVYLVFIPMPLFSIPSNLFAGVMTDRVEIKWMMILLLICMGISCLGVMMLSEPVGWWMFIVGNGLGGGVFGVITTAALPRFFGREHLGAISGVNMSIMVFASAIGPWMFDFLRNRFGSFQVPLLGMFGVVIVLMGMSIFANNPQRYVAKPREA